MHPTKLASAQAKRYF